jgi:predicted dehydrogenase
MTAGEPIRIGIVGLGRAGWGMHCKELETRQDKFKIVAVCDLIEERRQRAAERFGCRTYERVQDLVTDPEVELVDVATRSIDHFLHARLALEAHKPVFLEKPMCANFAEADALRALVPWTAPVYVRHNRRFDTGFQQVLEVIDSGLLGEVYQVKMRVHNYDRRDDWQTLLDYGGGQVLNWGPHLVDAGLCFIASPVESVWTDLKRVAALGDAEDHVKIVMRVRNGRVVDLEVSGGVALPEPMYAVWGMRGALVCDDKTVQLRYLDPNVALKDRQADPGTPGATFGTPEKLPWVEETRPVSPRVKSDISMIWDALYAAIREDVPYPITLDHSVEVMRIISLAREGTAFDRPV